MVKVERSARTATARSGVLAAVALSLGMGCGGSSTRHVLGDDGGAAGTKGGSSSGGSAAGGTGGTSTGGSSTGGSSTGGTSGGTGGTSGGTSGAGGTCGLPQPCPNVPCPDGDLTQSQCGCPVCSCENVACLDIGCGPGYEPARLPGACCDTCIPTQKPAGCEEVECEATQACPSGSTWRQEPGACCGACLFDVPQGCPEIACPDSPCPLGYVRGDGQYACCACVPDPGFCESDLNCVLATNLDTCCACPEAISDREYAAGACWSISPALPPDARSGAGAAPAPLCGNVPCPAIVCAACATNSYAKCEQNHCTLQGGPER